MSLTFECRPSETRDNRSFSPGQNYYSRATLFADAQQQRMKSPTVLKRSVDGGPGVHSSAKRVHRDTKVAPVDRIHLDSIPTATYFSLSRAQPVADSNHVCSAFLPCLTCMNKEIPECN
ncbi:hypothetical protein SARC_04737 [Sphaeroforma arctica JP610]|uniref:Uncharacterized protein n=1 Tax=Sphaeroforma arctica JP610 TaxID=667725 RepID=A0A0L0G2C8_9EUKA|nr:hypothetical protein SARC_04737 [Sphaeroforma arctica JP610]KNC82989.1 hypothetical protein SARC_04737 [Sphaeroforma arctica JP610]|eukprot:XP_014156891.1 hypothetical protein SARC_04737 [Sphaeroforma arctica JP610]